MVLTSFAVLIFFQRRCNSARRVRFSRFLSLSKCLKLVNSCELFKVRKLRTIIKLNIQYDIKSVRWRFLVQISVFTRFQVNETNISLQVNN